MKNLSKFTKAELINKYKKLENNNSNNQNNGQTLLQIILTFKS
jgi:hypothetical protein